MFRKQDSTQKFGIQQITTIGMLSAISIVLGTTGTGFVQLPLIKGTIFHIPVIIGSILEGPLAGMVIGLIFGLFSIFQNLTAPSVLSFALINPLVSVLPRMLIGITSYYCYKLKFGKSEPLRIGIGAAAGSLTNTVGVLGMIYLLYAARFAQARGISASAAAKAIFGIALTNGIAEAILAVIITIPVVISIRKVRKIG